EGRKQLASRLIIPFLHQHTYPEGGIAEAKRVRRREKEDFLQSIRCLPSAVHAAHCSRVLPKNGPGNSLRLVPAATDSELPSPSCGSAECLQCGNGRGTNDRSEVGMCNGRLLRAYVDGRERYQTDFSFGDYAGD
ncbi:unnamed protein product, partial [Sphacelaria rigidula]